MAKKTSSKASSLPVATDMPVRTYKRSKEDIEREKRYQAESDLRTMQQAKEIGESKERKAAMQALAKEQMKAAKC